MKLVVKILLGFVIALVLTIGIGAIFLFGGLESGKTLPVGKVNISTLKDGTYNGKYKGGRFSNEVDVIIKDNKIQNIEVVKSVTFEKSEVTKDVIEKVIINQNTDVDVVSGATVTSKAYLKSIENALRTTVN